MFVSVVCDIGNEDHKKAVFSLLSQYGFKNVINNLFESAAIKENTLLRLKRDIDKATDSYDQVRFYQYPVEDTMVISFLSGNRWRKIVITP